MKTNGIIIKDQKFSKEESKELLHNILNKQIEFLTLDYMTKWEKNHTIQSDDINLRIEQLKNKKLELQALINELSKENDALKVTLSFEINRVEKQNKPLLEVMMS